MYRIRLCRGALPSISIVLDVGQKRVVNILIGRRFAGAIGAEESKLRSLVDPKRNPFDGFEIAKAAVDQQPL